MDHVHAHLRAYPSDIAALPGGQLAESGGMLWSRTQIPWPRFNGAIATPR